MIGAFHGICGIAALLLGGWIFTTPKGTRFHVRLGWVYVASMLCLNASSLLIFHLTRGPNLFHAIAVAEIFLVVMGVVQIRYRARLRKSLWRHYQYMSWSYVGLLAATVNEAFVRVGLLRTIAAHTTAALPLVASALIVAISSIIIFRAQNALLSRFRGAGLE